jgi:glycosyltransferase involved in cell wall biosynthesis
MEAAHRVTHEAVATAGPAPLLFILDAFPDPHAGTEKQFWMLFQQLDRRRFDPRIILLRKSEFLERHVPKDRLTVLGIWSVRSLTAVRRAWQAVRQARRDGVRVAQIFFNDSSLLFPPLLRLAGIRTIVARRDLGFTYSKLMVRLLRMNRVFVDRVIANCEAVRRNCMDAEGHGSERVKVIYNGLAPDESPVESDLRAKWGLEPTAKVVLLLANLKLIKRQADLVRAFVQVRDKVPGAALVFGGGDTIGERGPSYRAELEQLAAELGVADRVRFLGKVSDAMSVIGSADVCVLCSQTEGLSNTVMEYMVAGKPVVCTNVGGNGELVRDGHEGLVVPVGDIDALGRSIVSLLGDSARARKFGASAAARVQQLCSNAAMVHAHEELYSALLP